jgi:hypothetical protein
VSVGAVSRISDPGPLARLEEVKGDVSLPSVIFQRLCDGETLREIAAAWQLPKGAFTHWFCVEHADLYDSALKVRADELVHDSLKIADGATVDTVAVEKLRTDVRQKIAAKWDRRRYGEEQESKQLSPVTIQIANLRGAPLTIEAGGAKLELPEQPMLERAEPESLI